MQDAAFAIHVGDALTVLKLMDSGSVDCIVTSPPYFKLRDYGHADQIGREDNAEEFVEALRVVFDEARRVLSDTGTLWLNLGDTYCRKTRQRLLVPHRVAMALAADGWLVRDEIVWSKRTTIPTSPRDKTACSHEMLFMFAKQPTYHYDALAIHEPCERVGQVRPPTKTTKFAGTKLKLPQCSGKTIVTKPTRAKRSVWELSSDSYRGGHVAVMPKKLAETCILAGCPIGGTVLDPFGGSGTTALAAMQNGRRAVLIELNDTYADIARQRCVSP